MTPRLTPTSYIVLGLVRWNPGASAYDLEQAIGGSVGHMWAIQRSQIYREPSRLAEAGLLSSEDETDGRRPRTRYTLTAAGEEAFAAWIARHEDQTPQLRDLAILKLFFGADPAQIAETRLLAHQSRLKEYESLLASGAGGLDGPRRALEAAILHERASVRFWSDQARESR